MVHGVHNGQVLKGGTASASPPATPSVSDFSEIKMAPSHSLYFENGAGTCTVGTNTTAACVTVIDPELTTSCEICHSGADAGNAFSKPSRVACGSCHTSVNFTGGTGHDGGFGLLDDGACTFCHPADGTIGYTSAGWMSPAPVKAVHGRWFEPAHKVNFQQILANAALTAYPLPDAGHNFQVTLDSVTANAAGALTYTATFTLDGSPFSVNPLPDATFRLATCAFQLAGPTGSDYVVPATGSTAQSCTTVANWVSTGTPGQFRYVGSAYLNGKADGVYTAAYEIMIQREITTPANAPGAGDKIRKPFSANPNFLQITKTGGATAVVSAGGAARRAVVSFDKCNNCHVDLGFHSNRGRKGPDYCATCHNPKLDNSGRARFKVSEAYQIPGQPAGTIGYLPESVSMNVFIHRIHMGDELSSVVSPATKSPLSAYRDPAVGRIAYGATRSAFVGLDAATAPDISDFSLFAMPNPMTRCDQCHISMATAGLPTGARAPVERNYRLCNPVTVSWDTVQWCNVTATTGAPAAGVVVVTPPMKAVCTGCHDSAAADTHADSFTTNPMTAGAVEQCAGCHSGQTHRPTFNGGTTYVP
jgi:OmcA/MtrC family decaheme c-type cytochrome